MKYAMNLADRELDILITVLSQDIKNRRAARSITPYMWAIIDEREVILFRLKREVTKRTNKLFKSLEESDK